MSSKKVLEFCNIQAVAGLPKPPEKRLSVAGAKRLGEDWLRSVVEVTKLDLRSNISPALRQISSD